jgi:hypothetical protein
MGMKHTALLASAATSLFAAAGANATIVGSNAATVGNSTSCFLNSARSCGPDPSFGSLSLTGTGTLDDSGTYTASSSGIVQVQGFPYGTISSTETFMGSYAGGTFTPTAGSLDITSCTGGKTVCAGATNPAVRPFNTGVGGSLTLAGGTLTGTAYQPSAGTVPSATSSYSFVIGAFTPVGGSSSGGPKVPLPPAAWLLGSGLLGLLGTARRRRC